MVAEVFAGLSAIKTAFDIAQGLQNIHDVAAHDRAVIELQKEILAAQAAQATLVEAVGGLKKRVTELEAWDADKQRYELREVSANVFAYTPKQSHRERRTIPYALRKLLPARREVDSPRNARAENATQGTRMPQPQM